MKILLTSVGRRVELVQALHSAAERLRIDLTIIGADISDTAPALAFCDKTETICRISDANYIPNLLQRCKEQQIDALIPTIDTDLLLLSEHKSEFEAIGTKVWVSAADKVTICRDKRLTTNYFISLGLKSPRPVDDISDYQGGFPAFIKPKNGSSSIDAYKIENFDDLVLYAKKIPQYIIQPFIFGKEFTIDIFCDYQGNPVYITPRERLAVRAGEVIKTRIDLNATMIQDMEKLVADFKPSGAITVQLIHDENSGDNYYIEINPRFGGGAPISMKAGADSAESLLRILNGEVPTYMPNAAKDGAIYSRYDQSVCING